MGGQGQKEKDMFKKIQDEIRKICSEDLYEIGFASLRGLLEPQWSRYRSGISLARKLDDSIIDGISDGPTNAYYDHYHRVNVELHQKGEEIVKLLSDYDIEAVSVKPTVKDHELDEDYRKTLRYSFSHKMIATRSGTGWIGKTDLLVTRKFGPRVRLASILMTAAVPVIAEPVNESLCGTCNICVESCPAKASTGKLWSTGIDRNEFFDPFRCRAYCRKISAEKIQKEISLCGICVSVCPRRQ